MSYSALYVLYLLFRPSLNKDYDFILGVLIKNKVKSCP